MSNTYLYNRIRIRSPINSFKNTKLLGKRIFVVFFSTRLIQNYQTKIHNNTNIITIKSKIPQPIGLLKRNTIRVGNPQNISARIMSTIIAAPINPNIPQKLSNIINLLINIWLFYKI